MAIHENILTSTKKSLGLGEAYDAFDHDVMTHLNSCFFTLHQLGIGPEGGFVIETGEETWTDFVSDQISRVAKNALREYCFLKVRLAFDPPTAPHHINAMNEQIDELEYRLQSERELTTNGIWT